MLDRLGECDRKQDLTHAKYCVEIILPVGSHNVWVRSSWGDHPRANSQNRIAICYRALEKWNFSVNSIPIGIDNSTVQILPFHVAQSLAKKTIPFEVQQAYRNG